MKKKTHQIYVGLEDSRQACIKFEKKKIIQDFFKNKY